VTLGSCWVSSISSREAVSVGGGGRHGYAADCAAPMAMAMADFYLNFLPAKIRARARSRFLFRISSRQNQGVDFYFCIILNSFPPKRGVDFYFVFLPAKSRSRLSKNETFDHDDDDPSTPVSALPPLLDNTTCAGPSAARYSYQHTPILPTSIIHWFQKGRGRHGCAVAIADNGPHDRPMVEINTKHRTSKYRARR
jgi:hypothetical protein